MRVDRLHNCFCATKPFHFPIQINMKSNTHFHKVGLAIIVSLLLTACGDDSSAPAEVPVTTSTASAENATAATSEPANNDAPIGEANPTTMPVAAEGNGTASNGGVMVDTGFRPEVNGFAIPNYGGEGVDPKSGQTFPVVNLTPVEMRRMFGDAVCAATPDASGSCPLTPPADRWMQEENASMKGGHCEGFAVLSQLIYSGVVDVQKFGAVKTFDLEVPGNEVLQRELAYWFATQSAIWGKQQSLSPKEMVDYLNEQYAKDARDLFRLGITKEDKTGGHAITAYAVKDQGNGIFWVMVYDNNYPGEERHMTVDANANTWEYEAAINPTVQPDLYKGGVNNPVFLAANQPRLGTFDCPFCATGGSSGKGGNNLAAVAPSFNEFYSEGYINVELQDEKGHRIGYDENGKFINEISEAYMEPSFNETLKEVAPTIKMPTGMDFTAYIWGDKEAASIPASLVMIGKGFYIGIDDLIMAPDQEDQLFVDGGGDAMNYKTDAQESPTIIAGVEQPGADFELSLKAVKVLKGTDIAVNFDQKESTFAFQTTSDGPAEFEISIQRLDKDGKEEIFDLGDTPLTIESGKLMYFYFGKWEGQGSNLEIGYDENGDGKIEESEITNMADAK